MSGNRDERLAPARGCLNGLLIAGTFWLCLLALYFWLRR